MSETLTQQDVAAELRTNTKQVIRWWQQGRLHGSRLGRQTFRFTRESVDAFLAATDNSERVEAAGLMPRLALTS